MRSQSVARLYLKVARLWEQSPVGWCRGSYSRDGKVCAVGALAKFGRVDIGEYWKPSPHASMTLEAANDCGKVNDKAGAIRLLRRAASYFERAK